MPKSRTSLLVILLLAAGAAAVFLSLKSDSASAQKKAKGRPSQTRETLKNYDIRADKSARAHIEHFRSRAGRSEEYIAGVRDRLTSGEDTLNRRVRSLKVERNEVTDVPEVVATDTTEANSEL